MRDTESNVFSHQSSLICETDTWQTKGERQEKGEVTDRDGEEGSEEYLIISRQTSKTQREQGNESKVKHIQSFLHGAILIIYTSSYC